MRSPLAHAARNADFGALQETFLVAGVATVLVIRTQLWLTHYPQLGGAGLHIAHLLYGGLLMAVAIGIAITFLGWRARQVVAIVGGVGFGFFIDELGKFITADNDYFFKPASALIYLTFVGMFMLMRSLRRRGELTDTERLANAIDIAAGAASHPVAERERRRALELLDGADPASPLVPEVRDLVLAVDALPDPEPTRLARLAARVRAASARIAAQAWFPSAVGGAFVLWAVGSAVVVLELVLSLALDLGGAREGFSSDALGDLSALNLASLGSSLVSAWLVVAGLRRLRGGAHVDGYRLLTHALLVSILVTRVFVFVESQFSAVFGLGVDLVLLATVRYLADREGAARPQPVPAVVAGAAE